MTKKINIAVIDDHLLFRNGIISILDKIEDFSIIGNYNSGQELLDNLEKKKVHVALIDLSMPMMGGEQTIQLAKKKYPDLKFIVLTMHDDAQYIISSLQNGASGYLLKSVHEKELITAIREVAAGKKYYSEEVKQLMMENIADKKSSSDENLSAREIQIIKMISEGKKTKEIAAQLFVSSRTIDTHRLNIFKKLNVQNSAELIKKSLQLKLLK